MSSPPGYIDKKIVVLHNGWMLVGDCYLDDDGWYMISNGALILKSTSSGKLGGIGELAEKGPSQKTVLDPIGNTTFHRNAIVFFTSCSEVWDKVDMSKYKGMP